MTNLRELFPEALSVASRAGIASPGKMPLLAPIPPAISEAESKPTHRRTPGCAHRVEKLWLPGGGGGGEPATVTVAEALPLLPDPEQVRE
jgi:hypothetical protein